MTFSRCDLRALFFDVFGTLVDWRTGVAREAEAHAYQASVDIASLAPNAEVTVYP